MQGNQWVWVDAYSGSLCLRANDGDEGYGYIRLCPDAVAGIPVGLEILRFRLSLADLERFIGSPLWFIGVIPHSAARLDAKYEKTGIATPVNANFQKPR